MNNNQNVKKINNILVSIPTTPKLHLSSIVLKNNSIIPNVHTKQNGNVMIPLSWYSEAQINNIGSYALICVDLHPNAKEWVHLYIPKIAIEKSAFINNNVKKLNNNESIIGKNSFGERGYGGPQPPKGSGKHKYVFYLFALDKSVDIDSSEKDKCKNVVQFINMVGKENIITYASLIGFYE